MRPFWWVKYSTILGHDLVLLIKVFIALYLQGLGRHLRAKLGPTVGCYGFWQGSFCPSCDRNTSHPQWTASAPLASGLIWHFGADIHHSCVSCLHIPHTHFAHPCSAFQTASQSSQRQSGWLSPCCRFVVYYDFIPRTKLHRIVMPKLVPLYSFYSMKLGIVLQFWFRMALEWQ